MIRCIVCLIDMSIRIYIPIDFRYLLKENLDQLKNSYENSTHQQSSSEQDLGATVLEDEDQPVTANSQSMAIEDVNDSKST